MQMNWKKYIEYHSPTVHVLVGASLPMLAGIYNFGWRVAAVVLWAMAVCWVSELLFTRKENKPPSIACLVTGMLLALILPPTVPFWIVAVGCIFSIVFGKMAFGGFGKNVFNPAMVGRCFLYICFPVFVVTAWYQPYPWTVEQNLQMGGFAHWTVPESLRTKSFEEQPYEIDAVSSATTLRSSKKLNAMVLEGDQKALSAFHNIDLKRLLLGNMNGCMGETSALMILLALVYLIYRRAVYVSLVIAPLIGAILTGAVLTSAGVVVLPFVKSTMVNLLAGGTLFAVTFMTTEPISAPRNNKARWIYGFLIGVFAMIIRTTSVWPAGLMFSILLGNMFGPIIEIGCDTWDARKKAQA